MRVAIFRLFSAPGLFMAGFLLQPALGGTPLDSPPPDVARYLADRGVRVSAGEMAAIDKAAPSGAPAKADVTTRLKAMGLPPAGKLGGGVNLFLCDGMDEAGIRDKAAKSGLDLGPVLLSKHSPLRVVPLPRVVFSLREGADLDDAEPGVAANAKPLRGRQFVVEVESGGDIWSSLRVAAGLAADPAVEWAVPDCAREARKGYLPNDIAGQWHLHNTNAVSHTNSAALPPAWDTSLGDPGVVIAILDDGVDIQHSDLAPNIWTNPGEIAGDVLDNDGNGYTNDVNGWDFYKGTNSIVPDDSDENHGTGCAGVAAARGGNGLGVSGAGPQCRILPVKVWDGNLFLTDSQWAAAVLYASRYARVLSLSLSTSEILSNQLVDAFNAASTSSLIFAATGNDADLAVYQTDCDYNYDLYSWTVYSQSVAGAGSHTYRWTYKKDSSETRDGDCAWLDAVRLPSGQRFDFDDGSLPPGWTTGGSASWFASPETADPMVAGHYSMRSGDIADSQQSWLQVTTSGAGYVTFYYQVFGERGCAGGTGPYRYDYLTFSVDNITNFADVNESPWEWSADFTPVGYPAALTSVVAVGASTIDGFHSAYSCFGTNLEVVAPSSGSTAEDRIRTTDRSGAAGYSTTDYDDGFGGTSSSTPLAAGIAGLIFSANPHLTPAEVRQLLRQTARKIGTVPYSGGFNERYGYGQVDAAAAMKRMLSNMPPEFAVVQIATNKIRFATLGIETGRTFNVHAASTVDANGAWVWQPLSPADQLGAPIFGTNWTAPVDFDPTVRVYRIVK